MFSRLTKGLVTIALVLTLGPLHATAATTEMLSKSSDGQPGNAPSGFLSISEDGQTIVFTSMATNLGPATNSIVQTFVYDRRANTLDCIPRYFATDRGFCLPSVSSDGRFITFSLSPRFLGTTLPKPMVYVWDGTTHTMEPVSVAPDGKDADGEAVHSAINGDGRFVAFTSPASNLVKGIGNGKHQLYVRDMLRKETECVSVAADGTSADEDCMLGWISESGRFVNFVTISQNLIPGITGAQVYMFDRQKRTLECISRYSQGQEMASSYGSSMSRDGRYLAFTSADPISNKSGVCVRDRQTNNTVCATAFDRSVSYYCPLMSSDGKHVAFWSGKDFYVANLVSGKVLCASLAPDGSLANASEFNDSGLAISGTGRFCAFISPSTNLVPGILNGLPQVYLCDLFSGQDILLAGTTAYGSIFYSESSDRLKNVSGSLSQIRLGDLDKDGINDLVGIANNGTVWYTTDKTYWRQIPGFLSKIALGDLNGTRSKCIAGLAADASIWYSTDLNTWKQIPGRLNSIVTGNFAGKGKDGIAGIALNGTIWYSGDLSTWKQIPGHLSKIWAADIDLDAVDDLIGITSDGTIWYTTDRQNWAKIPGRLADIVVGNFTGAGVSIAGRASDGSVWYTTDKQTWKRIPGRLQSVTVVDFDGWDELAGTSADGQIWYTKNLRDWIKIPGTLSTLHSDRY